MSSQGRTPEPGDGYTSLESARAFADALARPPMKWITSDYVRLVGRALPPGGALKVLELGCGPGVGTVRLAKAHPSWEITGFDISKEMLTLAKERANYSGARIQFVQGDASRLPFEDGSFDAVIAHLCFHEFSDPQAVVRQAHRVLAPGGRLFFRDLRRPPNFLLPVADLISNLLHPDREMQSQTRSSVRAAYTGREAAAIFSEAGFEAEVKTNVSIYFGPCITITAAKKWS